MKTAGMFFLCMALYAQDPYVNYRGVVNAASFAPPGISGSEIARGSMFSIFGTNMGPGTLAQVSSFPLLATLSGVSVKVTQGSVSVDALPVVVTAGQINAIMPSNAPLGRHQLYDSWRRMGILGLPGRVGPEGTWDIYAAAERPLPVSVE